MADQNYYNSPNSSDNYFSNHRGQQSSGNWQGSRPFVPPSRPYNHSVVTSPRGPNQPLMPPAFGNMQGNPHHSPVRSWSVPSDQSLNPHPISHGDWQRMMPPPHRGSWQRMPPRGHQQHPPLYPRLQTSMSPQMGQQLNSQSFARSRSPFDPNSVIRRPPPLTSNNPATNLPNDNEPSHVSRQNLSHKSFDCPPQPGDQNWLKNWLNKLEPKKRTKMKSKFGLRDIQNKLLMYANLLRELEDISLLMDSRYPSDLHSDHSETMNSLHSRADDIKRDLDGVRGFFEDPSTTNDIKELISARRNKRARKKRSDARWKLKREKILKDRRNKEQQIDLSLKRIQEAHKEQLMAKKMKAMADNVLKEVRMKQQEAKEVRAVVESLQKLRQTRLKKGETHGFVGTQQSQESFDKMADELNKLVEERTTEYDLEEKTLRIMMDEEAPTTSSSSRSADDMEQGANQQLYQVLFGTEPLQESVSSLDSLVKIRFDWDQFVTEASNDLASSVPLGWVVPPIHPSGQWSDYQKSN